MLNYSKLAFSSRLKGILNEQGFEDDNAILYFLEQYKYYSHEKLLEFIRTSVDSNAGDVNGSKEHAIGLTALEQQYDVVIYEDDFTYDVVYSCINPINRIGIEMGINNIKAINFIATTPYRFSILQKHSYKSLDALSVLKRIIIAALDTKATDIHFDVAHTEEGTIYPISFRVDNRLKRVELFEIDKKLNKGIIGALIEQKTNANALDLMDAGGIETSATDIVGDDVTLRITANRVNDGYHYVIRMQKSTTVSLHINELGFSQDVENALYKITKKRCGITFITGAVRTGKNTTAFALANEMKDKEIKIVSYESPIEVLMPFSQIDYQGNTEILLNAIRLAKKQDVNVAFINELPSKEVAFAVQDLANSSIHVITTMHVDRVWHLPYKLKEYYGDDYKDIISQINAVFNQKMFVKACTKCQETILVDSISDKSIATFLKSRGLTKIKHSLGCQYCSGTGKVFGSNRPYAEYIVFTDEIKRSLLACESPADMELVLHEYAEANKLENVVFNAIKAGEVNYDSLDVL